MRPISALGGTKSHPGRRRSAASESLWSGLRWIILAIVLTRSFLDPIFDSSNLGLGGVLNAFVILIALILILQRPNMMPAWAIWMWVPYLSLSAVAVFLSPLPATAVRQFLVTVSYAMFFLFPFFILRYRSDLSRFFAVALASAVVPILYGLVITAVWIRDPEFRLWSTFSHPNILSFYLVLQIALVLFVQVSTAIDWSTQTRRLVTLALPFLLLLLYITKTRSAWVAAGALFLIYAVWCDRRFLFLFLLTPLLLLFDTGVAERLSDLRGGIGPGDLDQLNEEIRLDSLTWRKVLWNSAAPWMWEKPLLGHGLGSFNLYSTEFFSRLIIDGMGVDAHSLYIETLFEVGLLGLLALALVFIVLGIRLLKGMPYDGKGAIIMLGLLLAYLLESYSDNMSRYLAFNWYFYFVVGTFCAWVRLESIKEGLQQSERSVTT